jgi:serine/threonine protein kinase
MACSSNWGPEGKKTLTPFTLKYIFRIKTQQKMLVLNEKIGAGTYGEVFKGILQSTQEPIAVKRYHNENISSQGIPVGVLRELIFLHSLPSHPNIVAVRRVEWIDDKIQFAMPLYPGDLSDMLKNELDIPTCLCLTRQLISGVDHMHKHGIFHRDLKPCNLLVNPNTLDLVICDFSLASAYHSRLDHSLSVQTRYYRAPEILLGETKYGPEVDMWSVGCIVAAMLLRAHLFRGNCEIGQIFEIFSLLGTPTLEEWPRWKKLCYYHSALPKFPRRSPLQHFPTLTDPALSTILFHTLQLNPQMRYTSKGALERVTIAPL